MKGKVILGVCGGISCYKSVELVRLLRKSGMDVRVVMTPAATEFIRPLLFEEISSNRVYVDMFVPREEIAHISLSGWADICVIAPLSANTLSKISSGICDNLLTTLVCALPLSVKIVCAPAMNENMWKNPIIQKNVRYLKKDKRFIFLGPEKGKLACGDVGEGRMVEPETILRNLKKIIR